MIKLTKEEKIIALFMSVQYKYIKMGSLSENAQLFYSNILYRLSKRGGSPNSECVDILKSFLSIKEKIENKMFLMIDLDDFPNTKKGKYLTDFLTDENYALQKFAKEYIRDILTEERVNNILEVAEDFKNEILKKYTKE